MSDHPNDLPDGYVRVPIGEAVAAAGVEDLVIEPDDLIIGAVVIFKVRDGRDQTGVYVAHSDPARLS